MTTTLNRFISKLSDKWLPFFKLLCKNTIFLWNLECELALQQFKKYLTEPLLLFALDEGELLYVYLAISQHAATSVLLREVDGKQRPIYFISKMFIYCQIRYLPLEKLILALVLTLRKFMYYFQAYPIAVCIDFSLKNILSKADLSSRLSKWVVVLGHSNIKFLPRATIKGQVLADFMVEFSSQAVSPKQGCLVSVHKEGESSEVGFSKIQSLPKDEKVV